MELSLLCGANVLMIIKEDLDERVTVYSSKDDSDLLALFPRLPISEEYTNADVTLWIYRIVSATICGEQ